VIMVGAAATAFLITRLTQPTPMRRAEIAVVQSAPKTAEPLTVDDTEMPQRPADSEALPPTPDRVNPVVRARSKGPDPEALTRAFRKQESAMTGCFSRHAVSVEGMPVVKLTFALKADGKLSSVELSPQSLAQTALGQCIKKVASDTRFPAQGKPVSFAIPLSASRGRGT
jgi:hypothetical protein